MLSPADLSLLGQMAATQLSQSLCVSSVLSLAGPSTCHALLRSNLLCPDNLLGSFLTTSSAITPLGDLSQPVPHWQDESVCVGARSG